MEWLTDEKLRRYFQSEPLLEILIIADLQQRQNRIWICAEHDFIFFWMKLCSSQTTTPLRHNRFSTSIQGNTTQGQKIQSLYEPYLSEYQPHLSDTLKRCKDLTSSYFELIKIIFTYKVTFKLILSYFILITFCLSISILEQ